ncbi:PfkB family carbohydrate kinase [Synechococcus sp. MU1642]|uniref:PfkB family carbohydrate kinase n=1 Tax=Synechococcus sp. MU1642 TaxID=2508348 RepID=UPI00351D2F24
MPLSSVSSLPPLRLAVVGHVEWMEFLAVDQLPHPGTIGHALRTLQEPAGGGSVVAVQMARLQQQPVHFFTAIGRDSVGEACVKRLEDLGLVVHVAWREAPTRRGISLVDGEGDRAITVIGERLTPSLDDDLPWEALGECDGLFVTAADVPLLKACRAAAVMAATPRVRLPVLQKAGVSIDALIGSGLDPGEMVDLDQLNPAPHTMIRTEGAAGGLSLPGGRYEPAPLPGPIVESYGCGDSFAAGVVTGLAARWTLANAIALGAQCGAACATRFGPYG